MTSKCPIFPIHLFRIDTLATCTVCNSFAVPYPESCPSWSIAGYGVDDAFHITTTAVCTEDTKDDWIDYDTNTNANILSTHPLSLCSWNVSSMSDYYYLQDEEWNLFTVDTNGRPYYYNSDDVRYCARE